jgi:hypothetical protein
LFDETRSGLSGHSSVPLSPDGFHGEQDRVEAARDECHRLAVASFGTDTPPPTLEYHVSYPTEVAWNSGVTTAACTFASGTRPAHRTSAALVIHRR